LFVGGRRTNNSRGPKDDEDDGEERGGVTKEKEKEKEEEERKRKQIEQGVPAKCPLTSVGCQKFNSTQKRDCSLLVSFLQPREEKRLPISYFFFFPETWPRRQPELLHFTRKTHPSQKRATSSPPHRECSQERTLSRHTFALAQQRKNPDPIQSKVDV